MKQAQQDIAAIKQAMRREAEGRRAEAAASADAEAPERLARNVLSAVTTWPGAIASAYWPMRDELDPLPALKALAAKATQPAFRLFWAITSRLSFVPGNLASTL